MKYSFVVFLCIFLSGCYSDMSREDYNNAINTCHENDMMERLRYNSYGESRRVQYVLCVDRDGVEWSIRQLSTKKEK